ncbi:hypothetical protein R69776_03384 [Paraburkholderia nemoris]|uniref:Uncharacterized protein n=1 Tax=Paraburkholderia nemoris TaxID=2793076 RepID=A0ABN7LNV5_9BURK|nr:hypothetical protein R69776_03384 [Paraburkholderia nemoris]
MAALKTLWLTWWTSRTEREQLAMVSTIGYLSLLIGTVLFIANQLRT